MHRRTLFISRLAIILSLTIVIQLAGFPQPVTGPLINAMLFITATLFGNLAGIILSCLTPTAALIRGQLPPVLAPMVPFIAVGNIVLVLTYNFVVRQKFFKKIHLQSINKYVGISFAAFFKFFFLYLSVKIILPVILNIPLPSKIAVLMTTPQFITAVIGGIIALVMVKILLKVGFTENDTVV